jgi:hypothetical protein
MSGLISIDPLATLAMEAGIVRAPLAEAAAQGNTQLDTQQRAAVIGEPVPIVFCRRDEAAGTGGVLVSPAATEARFSNDASNAVTASYHLVLGEGRMGWIQVRDVFQRSCRVGSHTQTYDRRAGTWEPGNYITAHAGYTTPECPYYCGTIGVYTGMSTLSFQVTIPNGSDQWNRQVHCFIRNGIEVTRLLDNVTGSSNNFADLYQWMLSNCAKLSANQIDYSSLASTARFLHVNGFNCDINITESKNLGEMVAGMAPYFLLAETRVAGRRGLRPVLPTNTDGTIKTTPVEWVYTFTEDHILPDQLQINYVPSADRKPFAVRTIWRQQLDDDHGIIRSSDVRMVGEAEEGPYEQHDLSQFCTRENHAVKIAAYIRARRKYTTHTASVSCRTIDFPQTLQAGDIVRLKLYRSSDIAESGLWDYLYQIERITKTAAGDVSMDLVHFPINSSGVSPIALAVAETFGTGIMLTSNRTGVSCDASPSRVSDTSVPSEVYVIKPPVVATYVYAGGIWQSIEDVPGNIATEASPGQVINEPSEPPTEEPTEEKPEPAPVPPPEPTSGFTGPFAPENWIINRLVYNSATNDYSEEYPSIGSLGGYVEFTGTTATLYAQGLAPTLGARRFIISISPTYACTISFSWVFYPQSSGMFWNDDIPIVHYPFDDVFFLSGALPNGFNVSQLYGTVQSGTQTITADGTNKLAFEVDSADVDPFRGRLVISNFVVTPL